MRLFEMLLFFSDIIVLVLTLLLHKDRRIIPLLIASGTATLIMFIHWAAEGYRIQLLLLYGVTMMLLAVSMYHYVKKNALPRIPRFLRGLAYTAIVMMLVATAGLMYVFPVFKLPAPAGAFKVGTQAFHFVDTAQKESFDSTGGRSRELMVQVWYPAETSTGGAYAPWISSPGILSYMAEQYGLPGFTFQYLKFVASHAYPGAEIASASNQHPLIIVNPGNGSSRFLHTTQAEELASHGYIVAAIDHTYNTFATEFPDGRVVANTTDQLFSSQNDYMTESQTRDMLGKVLTEDVSFVLDQFELLQSGQTASRFKGKMDLAHVGIFGHSIGGATAYDASYDPRITAGIDLDGGLYRLQDRGRLHKPFMFMNSESNSKSFQRVMQNKVYTDAELKEMGSTREWENQTAQAKKLELQRMREAIEAGGQVLYIDNTEHLNFTNAQFISPIFQILGAIGQLAPERADAITNAYILDFFNKYLKKEGGKLLNEPDPRFPEVKFADL
ncbi:dienelactone hydrolase [Paenibacillus sp. FSL P2-0089]|uniref:alpha/beta hydrolase family protein n=1 Tax=Paenibacillus sp. FSL P2-0089 TaxID=2954526 RepID=UPI00315A519B